MRYMPEFSSQKINIREELGNAKSDKKVLRVDPGQTTPIWFVSSNKIRKLHKKTSCDVLQAAGLQLL